MSDQPHPSRLYGEEEIRRILFRATELQKTEPSLGAGGGMTLTDLEDVAAEAGIDIRHVRRAAIEVDSAGRGDSMWAPLLGGSPTLRRDTTLTGELPDDRLDDFLGIIQSTVSYHGQPSVVGRTLTWQGESPDKTRKLRVVISSRSGTTQIRIEENLSQMAGGLFGGLGAGVGIGVGVGAGLPAAGALGSAAFAVAAPLATITLRLVAARAIFRRIVNTRSGVIDRLFEGLVQEAQATIDQATFEGG